MFVLKELVCLAIFIILSALFAVAMVVAGYICEYRKKSAIKNSVYECGMQPVEDARVRFDIKYFNYAIMFLIFDIETIFLYPFAVYVNGLGAFAIIETFIFVLMLLLGLFVAIKKKLLRWV